MSDFVGIKISQLDVEVTEAELWELILHSDFPILKIKDIVAGSASLTDGGAGFDAQVIEHDLGYKPRFYLFATRYDPFLDTMITTYGLMPITEVSAGGVIGQFYNTFVDNTEIRFSGATFGGDSSSHTINYYCVIYYDED